jgi:hypothetical protein
VTRLRDLGWSPQRSIEAAIEEVFAFLDDQQLDRPGGSR